MPRQARTDTGWESEVPRNDCQYTHHEIAGFHLSPDKSLPLSN